MKAIERIKEWCRGKIQNACGISEVRDLLSRHSASLAQSERLIAQIDRLVNSLAQTEKLLRRVGRQANLLAQIEDSVTRFSWLAGRTLAADAAPASLRPLAYRTSLPVEQRGLFVLGSARSGTSILTDALNCSPDVLVLAEALLFMQAETANVPAIFNAAHRSYGHVRYKGSYLAPGIAVDLGPLALLERLGRHFAYVGDKVAIGPGDFWAKARTQIVDFFAEHYFPSRYLLTLRTPRECMLSMHKLFPFEPPESLIRCWLTGIETCIDVACNLPNVRWVFFEELGPELVARATADLDISLKIPPELFTSKKINTRLSSNELPPFFQSYERACSECDQIYQAMKAGMCAERLVCDPSEGGSRYWPGILARCDHLREQLAASDAACKRAA